MLATVVDFQDNFCLCKYHDYDNHRCYGYLNSAEIDDIKMPIYEKVSLGNKIFNLKLSYGKTSETRL